MTLLFFFQLLVIEIHQEMNQIMSYLRYEIGLILMVSSKPGLILTVSFKPESSKKAQQFIFYRKIKRPNHPLLIFNNIQPNQTPYQKHLGMFLDDKSNFGKHLKCITNKINKSIGRIRELQIILPRR